jgi:hypothetical protein
MSRFDILTIAALCIAAMPFIYAFFHICKEQSEDRTRNRIDQSSDGPGFGGYG